MRNTTGNQKISTIHDHQSSEGKISTHLSIRVLLIGSQHNNSSIPRVFLLFHYSFVTQKANASTPTVSSSQNYSIYTSQSDIGLLPTVPVVRILCRALPSLPRPFLVHGSFLSHSQTDRQINHDFTAVATTIADPVFSASAATMPAEAGSSGPCLQWCGSILPGPSTNLL